MNAVLTRLVEDENLSNRSYSDVPIEPYIVSSRNIHLHAPRLDMFIDFDLYCYSFSCLTLGAALRQGQSSQSCPNVAAGTDWSWQGRSRKDFVKALPSRLLIAVFSERKALRLSELSTASSHQSTSSTLLPRNSDLVRM